MTHRFVLWGIDGTLVTTGVVGRRALEGGAADAAGLDTVPEISMGGKTDPQIVAEILATADVEANAFVKVDTFGFAGFFDFVVGAYGSDHSDRDCLVPVTLERVARLRNERYLPREVWIIGDTANDWRCARARGVHCLLVATGREGLGPLGGLNPDYLFPDLSDTEAVLAALLGT